MKESLLLSIKTSAFLPVGTFPIVPCLFSISYVLLETGFCHVPLADLELTMFLNICLPQSPERCDSRHAPAMFWVGLSVNYPTQTHMFKCLVHSWGYCLGVCGTFCVMGLDGLRAITGAGLEGYSCLGVTWGLCFCLVSRPDGNRLHDSHINGSLCHTFPSIKLHFSQTLSHNKSFLYNACPGILSVRKVRKSLILDRAFFLQYNIFQAHNF